MIGEGFDYFKYLQQVVLGAKVAGPMIHDARIAAICVENSVRLPWAADRDFFRLTNLKTRNPLIQ